MRGSGSASSAILLLIALDLVEAQVARGRTVLLPAILYGGPVERRSVASRGCHPSRTWAFDASILHGRPRAAASRLPCARLPHPSGGRASPRYSQPAACWPLMARSSSLRRRRRRRRTGVRPQERERAAERIQYVLPGANCAGVAQDQRLAGGERAHVVGNDAVLGPVAADDVAGPRRGKRDYAFSSEKGPPPGPRLRVPRSPSRSCTDRSRPSARPRDRPRATRGSRSICRW
jgi:hypothetical protein